MTLREAFFFAAHSPRRGTMYGMMALAVAAWSAGSAVWAQAPADSGKVDPLAIIRRASQNEMRASNDGHPYRYKLRKIDEGKITTKLLIETTDGDVARLVAVEDKPLDDDANKTELDRLNNILAHPEIQAHRHQKEKEDGDRANEMIRLLPDAFIYKFAGMEPGPNGPAYRLTFEPNPNFTPPDREAEVYHGMEGEIWIDQGQERMVKLQTHLISDVNFGWGILGKLYKGGSVLVEQKDVGSHHWETTHFTLSITGKALMVKTLSFHTTEDSSNFEPVPPKTSSGDAVRMLKAANVK